MTNKHDNSMSHCARAGWTMMKELNKNCPSKISLTIAQRIAQWVKGTEQKHTCRNLGIKWRKTRRGRTSEILYMVNQSYFKEGCTLCFTVSYMTTGATGFLFISASSAISTVKEWLNGYCSTARTLLFNPQLYPENWILPF